MNLKKKKKSSKQNKARIRFQSLVGKTVASIRGSSLEPVWLAIKRECEDLIPIAQMINDALKINAENRQKFWTDLADWAFIPHEVVTGEWGLMLRIEGDNNTVTVQKWVDPRKKRNA